MASSKQGGTFGISPNMKQSRTDNGTSSDTRDLRGGVLRGGIENEDKGSQFAIKEPKEERGNLIILHKY